MVCMMIMQFRKKGKLLLLLRKYVCNDYFAEKKSNYLMPHIEIQEHDAEYLADQ